MGDPFREGDRVSVAIDATVSWSRRGRIGTVSEVPGFDSDLDDGQVGVDLDTDDPDAPELAIIDVAELVHEE